MLQISRQSIKARTSYSNFKKCCRKKKYKENKTNFEGAYLGNGLVDSAQIWNWRCPTPRKLTENFVYFCSGSVELHMREDSIFLTPVKYTLVYRTPKVSWAARHTTVCLDVLKQYCCICYIWIYQYLSLRLFLSIYKAEIKFKWSAKIAVAHFGQGLGCQSV